MSVVDSISTASPPRSDNAFSGLSSEEFLKVMFAELTNQDPLAPNDTNAMLQQIGTIRSIEADLALTNRLDDIVSQSEMTSAGSLIGKFIAGRDASGLDVAGYVGSVTVSREGIVLNLLSGYSVPLANVQEIFDPSLLDDAASGDDAPGDGDGAGGGGDSPIVPTGDDDGENQDINLITPVGVRPIVPSGNGGVTPTQL